MKIENQKLTVKEAFKNYYYIVPPYQRDYVWQTKNVEQLLGDIHEEFQKGDQSEYFIGSTVANRAGTDNATYEVIDGQQRLTTLFLALCAFKNLFKEQADFSQLIQPLISLMRKGKSLKIHVYSYNTRTLSIPYSESWMEMVRTTGYLINYHGSLSSL